jgi:hypothetical protein
MGIRRGRAPTATIALVAGLVVALLVPAVATELSDRGDAWPADAVIYHVFVDRFADGDADDTQVAGHPDDPAYAEALTDWMGGDLAGSGHVSTTSSRRAPTRSGSPPSRRGRSSTATTPPT